MHEVVGNLWTYQPADARVITTNGTRKSNGAAVMGRGCAKEALTRWPGVDKTLGEELRDNGNHVHLLFHDLLGGDLVSFPVKHNWWEKADPNLIERSAHELVALADTQEWAVVLVPRPGSGNGGLDYETQVRPIVNATLDDRFFVITFQ